MTPRKNPAAVALGRLGGKAKGKPKGLAALSPERRKEIARLGGLAGGKSRPGEAPRSS